MKAFLMFKDEDFNPGRDISENQDDLTRDLELDTLFSAMSDGDEFLRDVARAAMLAPLAEIASVEYRQDALKDCLSNPDVIREMYELPISAIREKRDRWLGIHSKHPTGVLSNAVKMIDMFLGLLRKLRTMAEKHAERFESDAFKRFFAMIKRELGMDYLAEIAEHLKELRFNDGILLSAAPGKGAEGGGYVLSRSGERSGGWLGGLFASPDESYAFHISPRDAPGAAALAELKDEGLVSAANSLAKAAEHIDACFKMLRLELGFYIGCLNLRDKLSAFGMPVGFPVISDPSNEKFAAEALYDPCLALTMKTPVVANNVDADYKRLIMITGANQGGKSTFLRAVGVGLLMGSAGMFVAAKSLSTSLHAGVFTHFKRGEDNEMKSGKLDEELRRMSSIVDRLRPGSWLLLNESFASTNEREGSEIAAELAEALLENGVRLCFVTHFFELANGFREKHPELALFLRAEREENGDRSFKLRSAAPSRTSFGEDLYKKIFHC